MNTIRLSDDIVDMRPCVATIGFFDGVHRGHRYLIKTVIEEAWQRGLESTVITFDRHPRQVLHSDFQPRMLSTYDEKIALLSKTGVDNCVVLPFNEEMASLSAYDFMQSVLSGKLNVRALVTGYDNRFGHNRSEGFEDYVRYGRMMGIDVLCGEPFVLNGVNVSSSVIRSFLQEGEVEMASMCLGYPYTVVGHVVRGEHIGTGIGFPTANLVPDDASKLMPNGGVYAVRVAIAGMPEAGPAMMNIGNRPTFGGTTTTHEVHIFHFSDDIYNRQMGVSFHKRLRAERKFRTADELVGQLKKDAEEAQRYLNKD